MKYEETRFFSVAVSVSVSEFFGFRMRDTPLSNCEREFLLDIIKERKVMCILCTHTLSRLLSQYNQFLFSVPDSPPIRARFIVLNFCSVILPQIADSAPFQLYEYIVDAI